MKCISYIIIVALVMMFSLTAAEEDNSEGYLQVTGPCGLKFPRDHGAHPGYRTEWWYYTGNLESEGNQLYGFQLTIFRSQITPPDENVASTQQKSAWRTDQVYFGHAAITDIKGGNHLQAESIARGALGLAGAVQNNDVTTIWLQNWSITIGPDGHSLSAQTPEFSIILNNSPIKQPVLHGNNGYSQKGSGEGRASCYYSLTRMSAEGKLTIGNQVISVRGLSWMDHEYSTALLEPGIVGWDWFSLQLSDHSEIMFFLLRTESGNLHPASSGTYIDPIGKTTHLKLKDISVSVLDRWKSTASDSIYPSRWRFQIHPLNIDLFIAPKVADQEMKTTQTTGTTYWEGSVSVKGQAGRKQVAGRGYVELTGYAKAFDAPM